jgi:hypothetical protein
MRAEHFIHDVMTPICDKLGRARDLHEQFRRAHRRTLSVKEMLVDLRREQQEIREQRISESVQPRPMARVIPLTPREPRGR